MKPVASRLLVFGLLYACWMAYLGYLVLTRPLTPAAQPLVLSRPQIDVSEVDVLAELPAPTAATADGIEVTVKQVLSAKGGEVQEGQSIRVLNLDDCHPDARINGSPAPQDWAAAGLTPEDVYAVLKGREARSGLEEKAARGAP